MSTIKFLSAKFLSALVFCAIFGGTAFAVDFHIVTDEADSIYGRGVHAFFDGDYEEAIAILSQAEKQRNEDPRSYYFLGLAYLRQKKTEQADQSFKKAAQLEYSGRLSRDYAVSETLRRIQGEERLRIEKIRTDERVNAQIREQTFQELRYGSGMTAGNTAVRDNPTLSPPQIQPPPQTQNQREDVTALQRAMSGFGGGAFAPGAFGVAPMNPNSATEAVVVRRADSNPFGNISEVPEAPRSIVPAALPPAPSRSRDRPAAAPARRTFTNETISVAQQDVIVEDQTAPNMDVIRSAQTEAARQIGRALGTLFLKNTDAE